MTRSPFSPRLLTLLVAAILVGMLSLLPAMPAAAQNVTLVTNFNQERAATPYNAGPVGKAVAQGFTTGGAAILSSIDVVGRSSVPGPDNRFGQEAIRAELWSATSSGAPNAKIVSLTVPADAFADTETTRGGQTIIRTVSEHGASVSFAAPANTRLEANTTYFLVVYTDATGGDLLVDVTSSDNEDYGSRPGWSIADRANGGLGQRPNDGFLISPARTANSLLIAVHGRPVAAPATVTLSAYPAQVWEGQHSRITATLSHALPWDVNIPVHVSPCPSGSWCHYLHSSKNRAIRVRAGDTTGSLRVLHPDNSVRYENKVQSEGVTVTGPYVSLLTFRDADAEHEEVTISLKSDLPANVRAGAKTSLDFTVLDPDGMTMTLTADRQPAEGNTNSRITQTLEAGTYTIEATTNEVEQLGSFELTVAGLGGTLGEPQRTGNRCVETLSGDGTVNGSWAANCQSMVEGRGYARYYTFTLEEEAEVSINLESSVDTYLYLRSGDERSGSALREHNDIVVFEMPVTLDLGQPAPDGFYALVNTSASTATYSGSIPSTSNYDNCSRENPCPAIRDWTMEPRPQYHGTGDLEGLIAGGTLPEAPIGRPCAKFFSDGVCVRYVENPSESEWNSYQWQRVAWLKDWGGKQKKTIKITIGDDPEVDPGETIVLQATGYNFPVPVKNGKLESNKLTLTIKDNDGATDDTDAPILMGAVDTYARESGTGADSYARVPVWLNRPATQAVSVYYTTLTDTATVDVDYTLMQGTLTFAPGETRKEIRVPIKDDNLADSGEIFKIRLSNPTPSSLVRLADPEPEQAYAEVNVTIINDEADLEGLKLWGASAADAPFAALDIGAFDPATTDYAVTVPHGTTHAKIAGIEPQDAYLTLKAGIAGSTLTAVNSDTASPAVALAEGDTVLVVEATAPSGERKTYQVTVTREAPVNGAPAVAFPITDATIMNESGTHEVSLSGVFTDADGGATASSSNEGVATVSVAADYSTLTVTAQARGTATVTVTVADGDGGSVEDSFTVTVKAAPAVASAIADVSELGTGTTREVSLSGVFSDADGDSLTVTASSSNDAIAAVSVSADYSRLTLTGRGEGTATITATAQDSDGNGVSDAFDVTVVAAQPVNDAPTVASAIADATIASETGTHEVALSGVFTDADGDALTLSASSSDTAVATVSVAAEYASLTVRAVSAGTAMITVTAEDADGNRVSDTFAVTVSAPPEADAPGSASEQEQDEQEQDVVARYDANQDGVISLSEYRAAVSDLGNGVTVDDLVRIRQAWVDGGHQQ